MYGHIHMAIHRHIWSIYGHIWPAIGKEPGCLASRFCYIYMYTLSLYTFKIYRYIDFEHAQMTFHKHLCNLCN